MKKNNTCIVFALLMLLGLAPLLGGCGDKAKNSEILTPIAEHLHGRWLSSVQLEWKDGQWVEMPDDGGGQIFNFRHDEGIHLTAQSIVWMSNGETMVAGYLFHVDEENLALVAEGGSSLPLVKLTANELMVGNQHAVDLEADTLKAGPFRWIYTRDDQGERVLAERLLGRWLLKKCFVKQQDQWVETQQAKPDTAWHVYNENLQHLSISITNGKREENKSYWSVRGTASEGEVLFRKEYRGELLATNKVILEEDDTLMKIFYSRSYDPATGKVMEGEFMDTFQRVKE